MNNQIIASCSSCQAQFQVSSDLVGKQGRCPQCQATFTIGGATPSPNPDPRQPGAAFPPPSADPRQPGSVPHPQQFPPQAGVPPQQFYGAPMGMGAGRMEPHRVSNRLIVTLKYLQRSDNQRLILIEIEGYEESQPLLNCLNHEGIYYLIFIASAKW